MSEETGSFDKEAEKEKLREQLRREEENRRSTQHMSELLLKGATMTNKHCETCGDPLFRYEGRVFCPTCAQGEGGTTAEAGTSPTADSASGAESAEEGPAAIDRVATGSGSEERDPGTEGRAEPDADVPADVAGARAALVRKLASLAGQAEATEDVGRSRELLAAAREAAEALAAIDSVGR